MVSTFLLCSKNSRLVSLSSFAYWVVDVDPFVTFGFHKFPINEELYSRLGEKKHIHTKFCIINCFTSVSYFHKEEGIRVDNECTALYRCYHLESDTRCACLQCLLRCGRASQYCDVFENGTFPANHTVELHE